MPISFCVDSVSKQCRNNVSVRQTLVLKMRYYLNIKENLVNGDKGNIRALVWTQPLVGSDNHLVRLRLRLEEAATLISNKNNIKRKHYGSAPLL